MSNSKLIATVLDKVDTNWQEKLKRFAAQDVILVHGDATQCPISEPDNSFVSRILIFTDGGEQYCKHFNDGIEHFIPEVGTATGVAKNDLKKGKPFADEIQNLHDMLDGKIIVCNRWRVQNALFSKQGFNLDPANVLDLNLLVAAIKGDTTGKVEASDTEIPEYLYPDPYDWGSIVANIADCPTANTRSRSVFMYEIACKLHEMVNYELT